MRENRLDNAGNQQGTPKGGIINDEVVEIMYNEENREPPDGTCRADLVDEMKTEPFAVWNGSIHNTDIDDSNHDFNNCNLDADKEGHVRDTKSSSTMTSQMCVL